MCKIVIDMFTRAKVQISSLGKKARYSYRAAMLFAILVFPNILRSYSPIERGVSELTSLSDAGETTSRYENVKQHVYNIIFIY